MRLALVVLALVTTSPATSSQTQPATAPPIRITLSTKTPVIHVGDPLQLDMAIENLSENAVTLNWVYDDNGLDMSFIYDVRSADGRPVPPLPVKFGSAS